MKKSLFLMAILVVLVSFLPRMGQAYQLEHDFSLSAENGEVLSTLCAKMFRARMVNSNSVSDCQSETAQKSGLTDPNKIKIGQKLFMPFVSNYLEIGRKAGMKIGKTVVAMESPAPAPAIKDASTPSTPSLSTTTSTATAAPNEVLGWAPVDSKGQPIVLSSVSENSDRNPAIRAPEVGKSTVNNQPTMGRVPEVMSLKDALEMRQAAEIRLAAAQEELRRHELDLAANAKIPHGQAPQAFNISYETFDQPKKASRKVLYAFEASESAKRAVTRRQELRDIIEREQNIIRAASVAISTYART